MPNCVRLLLTHIVLTFGGTFILMMYFPNGADSMPDPLRLFWFYNLMAVIIHAIVVVVVGIWRSES